MSDHYLAVTDLPPEAQVALDLPDSLLPASLEGWKLRRYQATLSPTDAAYPRPGDFVLESPECSSREYGDSSVVTLHKGASAQYHCCLFWSTLHGRWEWF